MDPLGLRLSTAPLNTTSTTGKGQGPATGSGPSTVDPETAPGPATDPKKAQELADAARQFEGILVNMLMKSMRATLPKDSVFGDSSELKMYEEMRDEELSRSISEAGGIGLAPLIERQLGGDPDALEKLGHAVAAAREAGRRAMAVNATDVKGGLKAGSATAGVSGVDPQEEP